MTEPELLTLEHRHLRLETRRDPAAMDALLAPDFVEFGRSGTIHSGRQVVIDSLAAGTGKFEFVILDFRWIDLGPTAALTTYRLVEPGGQSLRSSLWQRIDGNWRLRFHQGTPIP